jgi:hypothetical protein
MESATPKRTTRTRKNRSDQSSETNAPSNGRGVSDDGRGSPEEASVSETRSRGESPVEDTDTELDPSVHATETARNVLTRMGQEFNDLSETNVTDAWKTYRRRLMENFGILCEVMSPKDITELSMKIDENIRGKNPGEGGSPLDAVRNFLNDTVN